MGMAICSCVQLPLNSASIPQADASIAFGKIAHSIEDRFDLAKDGLCHNHEHAGKYYELTINSNEKLFLLGKCGKILIKEGNQVIIDLKRESKWQQFLVPFIISAALPVLLQQQGTFALHSSCLQVAGKVVAFAGNSGMGKSTTVAAIAAHGGSLISDDVLTIKMDHAGQAWVYSEHHLIRMNPQSMQAIEENWVNEENRIAWDNQKWLVSPPEIVKSKLPLDQLYFLDWAVTDKTDIRPLDQFEAFNEIHLNTYRLYQPSKKLRASHFSWVSQLASCVPAKVVARVKNMNQLSQFVEAILKDISEIK